MTKARELAELSRTVSDSADATAITINSSEEVTFADDIFLADGKKVVLGAGSDLQIYHDGTHSRIVENNATGQFKIQGNNMQLLTSDGASTYLEGNASTGAVTLYHLSNAPRIATTSSGVDVTGSVVASTSMVVGDGEAYGFGDNSYRIEGKDDGTNARIGFVTGGSEAARFDSSGTLLLGKTNDTQANAGHVFFGSGAAYSSRNGFSWLFNRLSTDGEILRFQKDGSTVGSIGSVSGDIVVGTGDTGLRFYDAGRAIQPRHTDGSAANDVIDLGMSTNKFKDLYLSGQVFANVIGRSNDTNTTIDFPGSDVIEMYTAGVERLRIDQHGTLALGTTDTHAWHSIFDARLRIGARGCLTTTTASTQLGHNFYFDGAYKYIGADYATRYFQNNGEHVWVTAPSGSADGTITFAEKFRIADDGVAHFGGDVKVLSGDIQMGNGRGINFSPTGDGSGTMTSETLSDYEQGTWTPVFESSTTTVHNATYTKVGRVVHIQLYIGFTAAASSSQAQINGLPFPSATDTGQNNYSVCSIGFVGGANMSLLANALFANNGASYIYFHRIDGNASTVTKSTFNSNGCTDLIMSGFYMTNA